MGLKAGRLVVGLRCGGGNEGHYHEGEADDAGGTIVSCRTFGGSCSRCWLDDRTDTALAAGQHFVRPEGVRNPVTFEFGMFHRRGLDDGAALEMDLLGDLYPFATGYRNNTCIMPTT